MATNQSFSIFKFFFYLYAHLVILLVTHFLSYGDNPHSPYGILYIEKHCDSSTGSVLELQDASPCIPPSLGLLFKCMNYFMYVLW